MTMPRRITIRTRLTLWYLALYLVSGGVMLTVVYLLARQALNSADQSVVEAVQAIPAVTTMEPFPATSTPQVAARGDLTHVVEAARRDSLRTIVTQSGIVFAAMTLLTVGLSWLVASRALRPLRTITQITGQLSHDKLDARIPHAGPRDDIKVLTDSFNTMLDRLDRAFQAQRLFAANASHELRTPLTIIQTAAEKALSRPSRPESYYRDALTTVVAAAQRSERILAGLLVLAKLRRHAQHEPLDLAAVVRAATGAAAPAGPEVHTDLAPAPVHADPALIELLVRNLLDNALRYNIDGGAVWISTGVTGDRTTLRVANTGPDVPAADLPKLRQPFQRAATRTGGPDGSGLGLAIVDAVVDAHHAEWSLEPLAGGGLIVTVTFPAG
jgi:signal transduction histidine kinase